MKKLSIVLVLCLSIQSAFAQKIEVEEVEIDRTEYAEPVPEMSVKKKRRSFKNDYQWNRNYGNIKRLYPSGKQFVFSLKNGRTAMNPKQGYFTIPKSHENYDSLIEVLMMAANKSMVLNVRTKPHLNSSGYAEVVYLVLDFK